MPRVCPQPLPLVSQIKWARRRVLYLGGLECSLNLSVHLLQFVNKKCFFLLSKSSKTCKSNRYIHHTYTHTLISSSRNFFPQKIIALRSLPCAR